MTQLTLNLIQGSVSFNFTPDAAQNLRQEISKLMESLKEVTLQQKSGSKPSAKVPMEYQYTGNIFLELFCNPNIYPNPFSAKVLVTIRDEHLRLTSEAELTRLIEDLEKYLE